MDVPRADLTTPETAASTATSTTPAHETTDAALSAESNNTPAPGRTVHALRLAGTVLVTQPRILCWLPPLCWAALIFVLSSGQPSLGGLDLGEFGGFLMNLAHPGVFGVLALLLIPILGRKVGPHRMRWTKLSPVSGLWLIVIVGLYGFTDEVHQSTVEGRDASLLDFLSDFVGAFFVIRVVLYLGREDANSRGLWRWLLTGIACSAAAAGAATWYGARHGEGPWPF